MREKGKKYIKYLHKKGFTLAELLIVVAIIAVLVAVSIPIFTGRLEKARLAANEANIRSAKAAAIADWMDTARENGEEIDEELLSKIMRTFDTGIVAYAAPTHSGEQGSGEQGSGEQGSGSSTNQLYDGEPGGTERVYGYKTDTNGLYKPGGNYTQNESGVYTQIFVRINTVNAEITTSPHIEGGKTLPTFGANDFDTQSSTGSGSSGGNQNNTGGNTGGNSGGNTGGNIQIVPEPIATHGGGSN